MKNLLTRSLSGAVYVAIIIASIIWGDNRVYPIVCTLLAAIGLIEFNHICLGTQPQRGRNTLLGIDIVAMACGLLGVIYTIEPPFGNSAVFAMMAFLSLLYVVVRPVAQLYFKDINPIRSLTASFGGVLYIGVPLLSSCLIQITFGAGLLLALFIMIWCNDTGAFLLGITLGRHKLWERISPKKTWEGFFGGMVFCTGAAVACLYLFNGSLAITDIPLWNMIALGITVSIVSTWGDLVESLLKRCANIKDSGTLIPGHGGVLDRIDSLLLVMPWALLWLIVTNSI